MKKFGLEVPNFVVASLLLVTVSACSSTDTENEVEELSTSLTNTVEPAPSNPEPTEEQIREQEMLAVRTFYFDFDNADLKPETREALTYHAQRLLADPAASLRLEGHADDRGTREYNLGLGERRAQAVARYLQVQGVAASRLEIISYGEERPAVGESNEAAFSRNRRVELVF